MNDVINYQSKMYKLSITWERRERAGRTGRRAKEEEGEKERMNEKEVT